MTRSESVSKKFVRTCVNFVFNSFLHFPQVSDVKLEVRLDEVVESPFKKLVRESHVGCIDSLSFFICT